MVSGLGLVHRQESVAGLGALLALYRQIRHAALCAIDDEALLPPARSEAFVHLPKDAFRMWDAMEEVMSHRSHGWHRELVLNMDFMI